MSDKHERSRDTNNDDWGEVDRDGRGGSDSSCTSSSGGWKSSETAERWVDDDLDEDGETEVGSDGLTLGCNDTTTELRGVTWAENVANSSVEGKGDRGCKRLRAQAGAAREITWLESEITLERTLGRLTFCKYRRT